jgi:hypothetical protein
MAHYNIAGALTIHGEFDRAVEHFETALKMRMKAATIYNKQLSPTHPDVIKI